MLQPMLRPSIHWPRSLNSRSVRSISESWIRPFGQLDAMGLYTVYALKGFKGEGPGYVFSDAGVDVIVARDMSLKEPSGIFKREMMFSG